MVKRIALGLVAVLLVVVGSVFLLSNRRINATWDVPTESVTTASDSATLARGEHIWRIRGCVDCHLEDGTGLPFADAMPVMRLTASNLTGGAGGVAAEYATDELSDAAKRKRNPDTEHDDRSDERCLGDEQRHGALGLQRHDVLLVVG